MLLSKRKRVAMPVLSGNGHYIGMARKDQAGNILRANGSEKISLACFTRACIWGVFTMLNEYFSPQGFKAIGGPIDERAIALTADSI